MHAPLAFLPAFARRLPQAAAALAHRLKRNRRGNVMMIMGFALIPMTFATGMVIDYSRAARLQTKLNAAADAAALSATTKPMLDKSKEEACNAALRTFLNATQQKSSGLAFTASSDLRISVTETYASSAAVTFSCGTSILAIPSSPVAPVSRSATVTYTGRSANAFAGVLGASAINIGGTSTARSSKAAYYQIAFIVDVSNSMGIGGTASDITSLTQDKTIACAFACHDPNGTVPVSSSDWCDGHPLDGWCRINRNYCPWAGACGTKNPSVTYTDRRALAKLYGYKLKIDYVKDAVASFIDALQPQMPSGSDKYAVSIYGFGTGFSTIQSSTTNWTTLKSGSDNIDLEVAARSPAGYANQGWTYTTSGLSSLRTGLANVGNGTSATSRATYVVFISDGVEDIFDSTDPLGMYSRVTSYAYAQQCQALKEAGMTVFSIETAYPNVPNDNQYNVLVRDLPSRNGGRQIADVMQGCASSSNRYFMASDGPAIQSAVNQVFQSIQAETTRLSQ